MAEVSDETQEEVARIGQHWEPNYSPAQLLGRGWKVRPCILIKSGTTSTIMDVEGPGQYVGTYLAWGVNNSGWWGEGEIKFFLDGDGEFPTICGTGTEDYF